MNNRGQVLPIFVVLFPIFILLVSYIVDIGLMYTEKRRIINITNDAINYYIDNKDDTDVYDKTLSILNKNINGGKFSIELDDECVIINVILKHNSIFNIININNEISVTYKGNLNNKRVILWH